jgi:hypothetical protein
MKGPPPMDEDEWVEKLLSEVPPCSPRLLTATRNPLTAFRSPTAV